jgi:ryanodine receptor 2
VFFQHPDLMRSLSIHETVMQLMVNTLNKAQQQSAAVGSETGNTQRKSSIQSNGAIEIVAEPLNKVKLPPQSNKKCTKIVQVM